MLNLFYYDFGARLIKPDPNIYYRTEIIAVKIEVLANNVPYFVYFSASNILPGDCHVAAFRRLLAMTYFYLFG